MRKPLLITLALGTLGACSAETDATPTGDPTSMSPSGAPAPIDHAVFEGRWKITAFDGRPPVAVGASDGARAPSLTFSRTGYGGTAGCNALGGIGTLYGARFYTQVGPQTVMACPPPS
ncbi:MAG TPA: META domain-containing protein [Sphingomonas sp.]|jgi:heat shock protein HslJ